MPKQGPGVKPKQQATVKSKSSKNPHLQARVEYLIRAAQYLSEGKGSAAGDTKDSADARSLQKKQEATRETGHEDLSHQQDNASDIKQPDLEGSPRYLMNQARSVALKSQIRLPQQVKRAVCKRCDTPLGSERLSSTRIENLSTGVKKPWADVLVVTCMWCGCPKRFPVGATRQAKKKQRQSAAESSSGVQATDEMC